ncbi:hypothetical protein J4558_08360 [Leptolyngbya sp. 15MV]|nr:hypothetical protein J4558_08360 [Leptolyngbya sp. 15MV]
MRQAAAVLLLVLIAASCGAAPDRKLVAGPGMSVGEFNRLNRDNNARLRVDDSDWIGVNSPVTLELRFDGRTLAIPTSARGGGIQILSHGGSHHPNPARVASLSFNIGQTYAPLATVLQDLRPICEGLAEMADTAKKRLPTPAQVTARLAAQSDALRETEVCSGEGGELVFSVTVGHYMQAWRHGGDLSMVFVNGSVAQPVEPKLFDAGNFSSPARQTRLAANQCFTQN